jgi:hypothetical protein
MTYAINAGRFYGPPGGTIETYSAGTLTPLAAYTTAAGSTPHPTTINIPSSGYVQIWGGAGLSYRFIVKDSLGATVYDQDNITAGSVADTIRLSTLGVSADRGDASVTIVAGTDRQTQRFATTLTANRTVTLSTTGAVNGDKFRVVRTGLGSFTLAVGGLKTIPSATAGFVDVEYDGTAWRLTGYGTL